MNRSSPEDTAAVDIGEAAAIGEAVEAIAVAGDIVEAGEAIAEGEGATGEAAHRDHPSAGLVGVATAAPALEETGPTTAEVVIDPATEAGRIDQVTAAAIAPAQEGGIGQKEAAPRAPDTAAEAP